MQMCYAAGCSVLTSLPSCSPSHTGNQTPPANPPSGCISDRPSPRLRGNQGRTGATHPSSGGTNSAAHIHSVSEEGKKQKNTPMKPTNQKQRVCQVICMIARVLLWVSVRWLLPWSSLSTDTLLQHMQLRATIFIQYFSLIFIWLKKKQKKQHASHSISHLHVQPVGSRGTSSWRTWQTVTSGPCS